MIQKDVGFPGGIELKCKGGCLKIHKTLYSCKMRDQSSPEQLKMVSSLCDEKEKCAVQARREMFGNYECPGAPDSDMKLWITYSCDGGQDGTRLIEKSRTTTKTTTKTTTTTTISTTKWDKKGE